ncbi:MAG: hypothetical protein K6F66_08730 [Pseudobutyrivibrio sp.]|nr:hypothetical protein [Pseudobutyrivibrio sp.]
MKERTIITKVIPYISTIILVAAMMLSAELLHEKEIIFPEITALAVGYMVAKKRSWKVNGRRMISLITVCAIMGVAIVRYVPLDMYSQVIIAFTISQILFMYSGTTFAPFVSAIVLPVMMQTTSLVYPIAAIILTGAVILFHKLFLYTGIRQDEEYVPVVLNSFDDKIDTVLRILCVIVIGFFAIRSGYKFIIAPPLLVAFTEFSRPRNKVRNRPFRTIAVITACSLAGAVCRYIFAMELGMPLTVAALVATTIMLLLIHFTGMYMPPVGAITILSMIIPEESIFVYPLQILAGSTIIMILSRVLFMGRQDKRLMETDHELEAH